jgi:CubicO group peptidase (beta-lactamase class C family)
MMTRRAWIRAAAIVGIGAGAAASSVLAVGQQYGKPFGDLLRPANRYEAAIVEARGLLDKFMTENGVPGLSIAIGIDGDIVWSEGLGYANVEQRVLVTPLTRFRSGSVAKAITSSAAAVLSERGQLDYDAPVQKYVPSFPDKGAKITPRLLAGHLAGLRYYPNGTDDEEFYSAKQYHDVIETLTIFQADPLMHAPGSKYFYTTYGTNLLGAAIQGAAGKPFPAVMQELVFDPLRMHSTSMDEFDAIIPNRTSYYERNNPAPGGGYQKRSAWREAKTLGKLLNAPFVDNSNKWPGGGLITTPEDLVRFGSAHLQPGYLKADTLKVHFTPMHTADGKSTNYAMNWDIRTDAQGRMTWSKGGSSVGGKSNLLMFPREKLVVAIQHNLTNPNYGQLPNQIAELFLRRAASSSASPAR